MERIIRASLEMQPLRLPFRLLYLLKVMLAVGLAVLPFLCERIGNYKTSCGDATGI